ncbi:MAG: type III toxin-antitoxin system ToxN/AbiQ family toxin [Selenomonadaceae bacterium]|nr:type III toxin-antitoxin system ToxN/AbiQ family toxin [Selenomonadaceae bacterium]
MENIKFYEIHTAYINYLAPYAPHLFRNRQEGQGHERKYIGIILQVGEYDYFAPLSSFKSKHQRMKEGLDFIKIAPADRQRVLAGL